MSNLLLPILFLSCLSAHARFDGSEGGGGGDQMIVEFVSLATSLIRNGGLDYEDANVIEKALSGAKIVSVDTLMDPLSKRPVPNQKTLIAWGSPGLIQLKLSSGGSDDISWQSLRQQGKPVSHYIFHELYRASGIVGRNGRSPDDIFQLSIGKYHLDAYPLSSRYQACYMAISSVLYQKYKTQYSAFVDFKQISVTEDLGSAIGLIGFARINTWGEDAAPHHLGTYSVSATCIADDDGAYVLKDRNENGRADEGDFKLDYIDFDHY
jgi:hypothetical protein